MASSRWSVSPHSMARFSSSAALSLPAQPTGETQGTGVLKSRLSMRPEPGSGIARRRRELEHRVGVTGLSACSAKRARQSGSAHRSRRPAQHACVQLRAPSRGYGVEYRPSGQLVAEHQDLTLREEKPVGHAFVQLRGADARRRFGRSPAPPWRRSPRPPRWPPGRPGGAGEPGPAPRQPRWPACRRSPGAGSR